MGFEYLRVYMSRMFKSMDEVNAPEYEWRECLRVWMRRMLKSMDLVNVPAYGWG